MDLRQIAFEIGREYREVVNLGEMLDSFLITRKKRKKEMFKNEDIESNKYKENNK